LSGDPTFRELVRREKETLLNALAHQDLPFERMVAALRLPRDLSRNPLFQADFGLQNMPSHELTLGDAVLTELDEVAYESAKFDVSLTCAEDGDELYGGLEWATDLFDRATAERLSAHWRRVLEQAAARPDIRLSQLAWMDADERRRVLEEWNRTDAELCADPAHRQVEAWARRAPEAPAVFAADATLSYAELDARASRLAHRLVRMGVGPDRCVAVMLERSAALVVAELAVMKAGGAYLPLDPAGPAERAAYMLQTADAAVVLTRGGLRGRVPDSAAPVLALDEEAAALAAEPDGAPGVEVAPENLAYVIFTSGSTGRPKGVAVTHRGLSNLLAWYRAECGIGPGDHGMLMVTPTFDVSVLDAWGPLTAGAAVHAVPDALRPDPAGLLRWMDERGVTAWTCATPSAHAAIDEMRRGAPRPRALRVVVTGGEALRRRPPDGLRLVNIYGPAENACVSTAADVAPGGESLPSIGRPLPNHRAYVLDARLQPVPPGVPGDLYVAGAGLARGYVAGPGMTAERFVPSPFGAPGARMYATGDRVRWLAGGELEYLGRTDHQVKLRGFRIETGEIELALLAHPAVSQAAVVLRGEHGGRLAAYVAVSAGSPAPDAAELREHLRARVPDYMVPSVFVTMDALPLSPNGKVDRRALPDPVAEARAAARPPTGVEGRIARVWEELLGIGGVGLEDNFFEIGGHSMLIARMQERLAGELGREVTVVELFQFPTVASLAAHLDAGAAAGESADAAPAEAAERGSSRREMMRRRR
ncbi:MAG TPA: amino acid adenylation domain-containing protein, partial [Longimicrobium sp.]|nr:amino acid adenylation domain-containing protein [Longimicrobium sp.]